MNMTTQMTEAACPSCKATSVDVKATVHAGKWERSFFECASCQLTFTGAWSDSHEPAMPLPVLVDAAVA